jgi:succinate dehydrogenase / fumarate reductase cytochrome b subunit
LYYHFCTGIRHLWWDLGRGLELSDNEKSTKLVLGASAALTVITWLIALA